jgi:hypothetical protein
MVMKPNQEIMGYKCECINQKNEVGYGEKKL